LALTNCIITGNASLGGHGDTTIGTTGFGNGGLALGGALYCEGGGVDLQGVVVTNNTVSGGSPGFEIAEDSGNGGMASGGGIYASNVVLLLNDCSLVSNTVTGGGPPNLSDGNGGQGDAMGGSVFLSEGSRAVVNLCWFNGNTVTGGLGAKYTAAGAGRGGAVYNGGNLQVSDTIFYGNASASSPSGFSPAGQGGAICSSGSVAINGSSFVGNLAIGGNWGGWGFGSLQAGAGEGGAVWSSGSLMVTNSTFTANTAQGGTVLTFIGYSQGGPASGGGLFVGGGNALLVNTTIAANIAQGTNSPLQGGGFCITNGTATLRGSIVANSTGGDLWGTVVDGGYNICSDDSAGFSSIGSLNQADPMLSALADNGGATPTMSLLVGSPARDAIPSGFPTTDQRGVTRPQGPAADIGAFEANFVSAPATIVTQPNGAKVRAGTNVVFVVGASGTAPLSYQWFMNQTALTGATSQMLSLTNVQARDAGTYSVVVTNPYGVATSQGAVLVVDSTPLILSQPQSVTVPPGANTNFSVLSDGPSLAYQWWHNGTPVANGTALTLVISNAAPGAQGSYFVIVSNFAGVATSATATLSFDKSALSVVVPPADLSVTSGYPASFSVSVSGVPPFSYQWQHDGTPIAGATNSMLNLQAVTAGDAGAYSVVVTNEYLSVTSSSAQLTVTPGAVPPLLTVATLANNLAITFSAEAGRTYRLLSSTNFMTWSSVDTNKTFLAGLVQFVRPINQPRVFYRVVTP
jgi:hypothetical protein